MAMRQGLRLHKFGGVLYWLVDPVAEDFVRDKRRADKPHYTLEEATSMLEAMEPKPVRPAGRRRGACRPETASKISEAVRLREQGLSYSQIGDIMRLTKGRAHQLVVAARSLSAKKLPR